MTIVLLLLAAACGMKTINLPFINHPYAAEFGFYQLRLLQQRLAGFI